MNEIILGRMGKINHFNESCGVNNNAYFPSIRIKFHEFVSQNYLCVLFKWWMVAGVCCAKNQINKMFSVLFFSISPTDKQSVAINWKSFRISMVFALVAYISNENKNCFEFFESLTNSIPVLYSDCSLHVSCWMMNSKLNKLSIFNWRIYAHFIIIFITIEMAKNARIENRRKPQQSFHFVRKAISFIHLEFEIWYSVFGSKINVILSIYFLTPSLLLAVIKSSQSEKLLSHLK